MTIQTKKVNGQLLNRESGEFLENVQVEISLITPTNPNDYPQYEVFITTERFIAINADGYTLKLNEGISGYVGLHTRTSDMTQKKFKATLEGSPWANLKWFNSL